MLTAKERLIAMTKGALWVLIPTAFGVAGAELMGYLFTPQTNAEIAKGLMYGLWGFIAGNLYSSWVDARFSKKYSK